MRNLMLFAAATVLSTAMLRVQSTVQEGAKPTVTVKGCVAKETDVIKSDWKPGMGDEFVLFNATITSGIPPESRPRPGIYRVTGRQEPTLKDHLGHEIEITGTLEASPAARHGRASYDDGLPAPASAGEPSATNTPALTIVSIEMLSATCGR